MWIYPLFGHLNSNTISNLVLSILILTGTVPEGSADAVQPEVDLYEDLDFQDDSPIDYGYEEMSEGDIADDV